MKFLGPRILENIMRMRNFPLPPHLPRAAPVAPWPPSSHRSLSPPLPHPSQDLTAEEQRLLKSLEMCQQEQQDAYAQLEQVVQRPSTAA